jgi:hypothetical protein
MIAMIAVLIFAAPSCGTAQRTTPEVPSKSVQLRPDLSGSWIRVRNVKNFMDNTLRPIVNGKEVGPLFGERIVVTQDAGGLRVQSATSDAPPAKEFRLGDSPTQVGTVERVFWEMDTTKHVDTLVSLTEFNPLIGGVPGNGRSTLKLSLDPIGWLIVQESTNVSRKDQAPSTSRGELGDLMSTTTYAPEAPFKGVATATLSFDIAGDADACGLSRERVSSTVTGSLSGSITVIDGRTRADTAQIRVAVRAGRSQDPVTPAGAVVISVVRCESTISLDVTDRRNPPTTLYRDGRSFSGSPPDTAHWALQQIKTDLDELVNVIKLANAGRRPFD